MRIFVTGGTGFIGSQLVSSLAAGENMITVLSRRPLDYRCTDKVHYTDMVPDLNDGYDMIYHLAGMLGGKSDNLRDYVIPSTLLMREIIDRANPYIQTVVMSTAYVDAPTSHWKYVYVKKELEKMAGNYFSNLAIIRPGSVFGAGDLHHMPLFKMIQRLGRWTPIMGGNNRLCPTDVADVVYWLDPMRIKPGKTTIAGEAVTIRDFMQEIARALQVGKPFIKFPAVFKRDFFGVDRVFKSDVPLTYNWRTTIPNASDWYFQKGLVK